MKEIIVELEKGVWLANWVGNPPTTLKIDSAKKFKTEKAAKKAIKEAQKYKPFENARVCM